MELVTKILSSKFFSIFTDMIKVVNHWKLNIADREKLDFNSFVKKRLLLLSKFQFKPIKNFNLSLCLRLQFLLQNHLVACLDEKSLQVYSQYLCKENKKLILSIIQNKKNFDVILKELQNHNYAHLDFLIEIFYALKNNIDTFIKIQNLLNSIGFMDYFSNIISQIEFNDVDGVIFLEINSKYFSNRTNFLKLLELMMFFFYKNKNCFLEKFFPLSSTASKSSILKFLLTLPFQGTFQKSNTFVLRILEILITTISEIDDESLLYRKYFVITFIDVVERHNLFNNEYFFLILEMLIHNNELDMVRIILEKIDVWPLLIKNMSLIKKKSISITLIKISRCLLGQLEAWPSKDQLSILIGIWVDYLKKCRYNVISSSLSEVIQIVFNKSPNRMNEMLNECEFLEVATFVKPNADVGL